MATLLRRCVSIPAYVVLAALWFTGAPLWLGLAACADLVRGDRRLPITRAVLFLGLYLGCEVVGVMVALLLTPVALTGRPRVIAANAALQRAWTDVLFAGSRRVFGLTVEVEGLDQARRGPVLMFVRHTSTADTVLTAALVANPARLVLRYVLKAELLWDPCLDVVGQRLPNVFVRRDGSRGDAEVRAVAALAEGLGPQDGVLIYPEGTRFSPAKLQKAVDALRARGRVDLADLAAGFRHVLPPRLGGPLALLEATHGKVDVVLVEHTGFEAAASMASFFGGGLIGRTVRVRLRRFPAPKVAPELWVYERWAELDAWVARDGAPDSEEAAPCS